MTRQQLGTILGVVLAFAGVSKPALAQAQAPSAPPPSGDSVFRRTGSAGDQPVFQCLVDADSAEQQLRGDAPR